MFSRLVGRKTQGEIPQAPAAKPKKRDLFRQGAFSQLAERAVQKITDTKPHTLTSRESHLAEPVTPISNRLVTSESSPVEGKGNSVKTVIASRLSKEIRPVEKSLIEDENPLDESRPVKTERARSEYMSGEKGYLLETVISNQEADSKDWRYEDDNGHMYMDEKGNIHVVENDGSHRVWDMDENGDLHEVSLISDFQISDHYGTLLRFPAVQGSSSQIHSNDWRTRHVIDEYTGSQNTDPIFETSPDTDVASSSSSSSPESPIDYSHQQEMASKIKSIISPVQRGQEEISKYQAEIKRLQNKLSILEKQDPVVYQVLAPDIRELIEKIERKIEAKAGAQAIQQGYEALAEQFGPSFEQEFAETKAQIEQAHVIAGRNDVSADQVTLETLKSMEQTLTEMVRKSLAFS